MVLPSIDHVEQAIGALMQQFGIPGLAIALVSDQQIHYTNVFGSSRSTDKPLDPTSLFQAASLSKPVFAYGVLGLWQQSKLDLDIPLSQLFVDPAITAPHALTVTARHVLNHSTGFPNWREDVDQLTLIPRSMPGTCFSYSGEAFEYLQRVVEHLTGQPLHDYLAAQVLQPLRLHHSRFGWGTLATGEEQIDADGIATADGERVIASAAWSMLTTATDYANFLLAMLNPHEYSYGYLNTTSISAMLTPQIRLSKHPDLAWGLGWGLQQTALGPVFWHWGGPQNGYTSYTATSIARRTGVVLLTNSAQGLQVCHPLARLALGATQPAFDWILPEDTWTPTG